MADISEENLGNLRWAWRVWRKAVGPPVRKYFEEFVKLVNDGAKENGFNDYGEYWRDEYEENDLPRAIDNTLLEMKCLYQKLHAFVRYKLK